MPRRPDTPTSVAFTGTRRLAMLGIGTPQCTDPVRFVQSPSLIAFIEIVDATFGGALVLGVQTI